MGRAVTLAELRLRSLRAADMQTLSANQYAPVDEVNFLINESVSELHDILVLRYDDYFVRSYTLPLVSGVADTALPADFYKLRNVLLYYGSTTSQACVALEPFTERERPMLAVTIGGYPVGYQVNDGVITVLPASGLGTVVLRYVYQAPYLTLDTDTISYQVVPGWEAYIVTDVAVQLLTKAGRPEQAAALGQRRDRLMQRIVEAATRRDAGRPQQIIDVYGWSNTGRY